MKKSALLDYANRLKNDTKLTPRRIVARVAGVTFEGRQEKLCKIVPDTKIRLERDRRNDFDFYAVRVLAYIDSGWEHVGFVPATMSRRISESLDQGVTLMVGVHKVKGGYTTEDGTKLSFGLDIWIEGQLL